MVGTCGSLHKHVLGCRPGCNLIMGVCVGCIVLDQGAVRRGGLKCVGCVKLEKCIVGLYLHECLIGSPQKLISDISTTKLAPAQLSTVVGRVSVSRVVAK